MLSKTLSVREPLPTIATIKLSSFGALQMGLAGNLQLESASIQAACAMQFHHLKFARYYRDVLKKAQTSISERLAPQPGQNWKAVAGKLRETTKGSSSSTW